MSSSSESSHSSGASPSCASLRSATSPCARSLKTSARPACASGLARHASSTRVTTPRAPSPPAAVASRSGPPDASGPPPVSITPTGVARCAPRSSGPSAPVATQPPTVDRAKLSGRCGTSSPKPRRAASSSGPEMPGPTITRRLTGSTSSTRESCRRSSTASVAQSPRSSASTPAREARSAPSRDERHVVLGAGRDEPGDALGIVRAQHEVRRRDGVAAPAAHDVGIRGPRREREPHGGIVDDVGIPRQGAQHGRLDVRGRRRGVCRLGGGGRRRRLAKSPAQLPQRHLGGGHRGWRRLTEAPPEGARQRLFGPGIGHPTEG